MIDRRNIFLGGLLALLTDRDASAQGTSTLRRVGLLSFTDTLQSAPFYGALPARLAELGYVEGRNLKFEYRTAEGRQELLEPLAAELARQCEVVVTAGTEGLLQAMRKASSSLPLVMVATNFDPIERGYVASLARPGGMTTGIIFPRELATKQIDMLRQSVPRLERLGIIWSRVSLDQLRQAEAAAGAMGLSIVKLEVELSNLNFEAAFHTAISAQAQAILVLSGPQFYPERNRIAALALSNGLPTMFTFHHYARAGGLMSYGVSLPGAYRQVAGYVDRILKGARPAELPVEEVSQYELVVNLRTAKALGLTIPTGILLRADEAIE